MLKNPTEWKSIGLKGLLLAILSGIFFQLLSLLGKLTPWFDILKKISESIPPMTLLCIVLIEAVLIIILLILAFSKPPIEEFITRYNLKWRKKGKYIDPHPYCACCTPPVALMQTQQLYQTKETFYCPQHKEQKHYIARNTNAEEINWSVAYKKVCKEFKSSPVNSEIL